MSEARRNLVFCCDGTWNDHESSTNVNLFSDAVARFANATADLPAQVVHYEKGVGTRDSEFLKGGAIGAGGDKRVKEGYGFLRRHFAMAEWKPEQNRIFLLGFSRGAYHVRRLSGMLSFCGLTRRAVDEARAWKAYVNRDEKTAAKMKSDGRAFDVPIEMVGVWDTVKSTLDPDFDDKKLPSNVVKGYHSMAIDERRTLFPVLRWSQEKRRVLEVWFAGVHSDVGGGYEKKGLSNISFHWMVHRAAGHGLKFDGSRVSQAKRQSTARIHDSMGVMWLPLGSSERKIRPTDWVHKSVRTKVEGRSIYDPSNLPDQPCYWPPADGSA